MTYEYKIKIEQDEREKAAKVAMRNWRTCSLSELQRAVRCGFDGALIKLQKRYADALYR